MGLSSAAVLHDLVGHALKVVQVGSDYLLEVVSRLRSGAKGSSASADLTSKNVDANTEALHIALADWLGSQAPTVGQKTMASSIPVTVASDQPPIPVSLGMQSGSQTVTDLLLHAGSRSMIVNGSVTPVVFERAADPGDDIALTALRFVFSASFFTFGGASFGKGGGALPNGVTVGVIANDGSFDEDLITLTVNEDFLRLLEFNISQSGTTDVLAASLMFGPGVVLVGGSGDKVTVTINDDLTSGSRGISYFTATLYGTRI